MSIHNYPYRFFRCLLSLWFLLAVGFQTNVFGQFAELQDVPAIVSPKKISIPSSEYEAFLGFAARKQTLALEGFETFTLLADRQGKPVVEYALSGRWGYIHICADAQVPLAKVKRATAKAFTFFEDIEGAILDVRFNSVGEATQNEWMKYVYQKVFSGPVILLSSAKFNFPENWQRLLPWQFLPNETDAIVNHGGSIDTYKARTSEIKDAVILSALRKLRYPAPFEEFDEIW